MKRVISISIIMAILAANTSVMAAENKINPDAYKITTYSAPVESDIKKCYVFVDDPDMPYDVKWDYGKEYEAIIAKYDWDKVFDAKYYKKAFPILAALYNNNDDALLRHFVTVGIHEGRQGNEIFNPAEYAVKCDRKLNLLLQDSYEGYYIQYMSEANPKEYPGKDYPKQAKLVLTALQKSEIAGTNKLRSQDGVSDITLSSELNALASYRAYMDCVDHKSAHDWMYIEDNTTKIDKLLDAMHIDWYSESNINFRGCNRLIFPYHDYYSSAKHKKNLIDDTNKYLGVSNVYRDVKEYRSIQYDVYAKDKPEVDVPIK